MSKLKSCPFCGDSDMEFMLCGSLQSDTRPHLVEFGQHLCNGLSGCGCVGPMVEVPFDASDEMYLEKASVELWNKRQSQSTIMSVLNHYLLTHESDIAYGINDFGELKDLFVEVCGRLPVKDNV